MIDCTEKQLQQALKTYFEQHDKKEPIDMYILEKVILKIKKDGK